MLRPSTRAGRIEEGRRRVFQGAATLAFGFESGEEGTAMGRVFPGGAKK